MEHSTISISNVRGIPVTVYNRVERTSDAKVEYDGKIYDGFYISYNNHDIALYGDATTALVLGQMEKFFILNGNHVAGYDADFDRGFGKCLEYFENHFEQVNKYSDR